MATLILREPRRFPFDPRVVAVAVALAVWMGLATFTAAGGRQLALFIVGLLLGISLYHAHFGFTSAWRRLIVAGDGRGLRAQMLMLSVAVVLFFPLLVLAPRLGWSLGGAVAPAGVSVAVGAFLFGIGMQLGGGCASGTLFGAGGGSTRLVITLVFFIVGSVLGTLHLPFWFALPALPPLSLPLELGLLPALLLHLALFGGIALASRWWERRRGFRAPEENRGWHLLRGPWPLWAGAVALALLNALTLVLAGRPWGITWAFTLWGAKIADALDIGIREWTWWRPYAWVLDQPLLWDITTVMNLGIMIGALLAAGLAGAFRPRLRLAAGEIAAAALGGLLLGYGARLAFGCNIGAFFSGVASGSLHGWLWLLAALFGNALGVRLRPLFGLSRQG